MEPSGDRRRYVSPTRDASARETRARILAAARESFLTVGYAPTTIKALAAAAEVSEQTIYTRIGNKAAVLKAVYDIALAGDDEPVPMADRPHFRALGEATSVDELVAAYASIARTTVERMRPLVELVWGTRATDPDLEQLARVSADERRVGTAMFAEHVAKAGLLRPDLEQAELADLVWVLISPEVYLLQVRDGQLSDEAYERWLARALHAVLDPRA